MDTVIHTESLADVVARQSVTPEWLRELVAEHGLDTMVRTETRVTAFGNYLMGIEVY